MCSSPQVHSWSSTSLSEVPSGVSEYSTLGGTCWYSVRTIVYDYTRRIYRVVGEEVGGAWVAGKALM